MRESIGAIGRLKLYITPYNLGKNSQYRLSFKKETLTFSFTETEVISRCNLSSDESASTESLRPALTAMATVGKDDSQHNKTEAATLRNQHLPPLFRVCLKNGTKPSENGASVADFGARLALVRFRALLLSFAHTDGNLSLTQENCI
jgi:hypothetical protein